MSHPLTRRIAQAALLVAAGATPLAAAGSAAAAGLEPGDLGKSVTSLAGQDTQSHPSTLQGAAHNVGEAAGATGAATVQTGVPAAADATGATVASTAPQADALLGKVAGPADKAAEATGALATVADRVLPPVASKLGEAAGGHRSALPATGLPLAGNVTGLLPTTSALGGLTNTVPGADALGGLTGSAHQRLGGVPPLGNSPVDALPVSEVTSLLGGLGALGSLGGGLGG